MSFPPCYVPHQEHLQEQYFSLTRRHRRNNRSGRRPKPYDPPNVPAAIFGLACAVLLSVAEAHPNWFLIHGGRCDGRHMGLYKVISPKGNLESQCYTEDVVLKLQLVIVCCSFGIIFSMVACLFDLCGVNQCCIQWVRKNSVGNVAAAILTVLAILDCYWVTWSVEKNENSHYTGDKQTTVKFDVSFYLIVSGAACAVFATALNVITCRRPLQPQDEELSMDLLYSMVAADSIDVPPPEYSP